MESYIITISRAYGSGGSVIGRRIAEKLGIAYYDRNLIDQVAHERDLDKAYITNWEERISSINIWGADDSFARIWNRNYWKSGSLYYSDEKEMFRIQSRIICELAEKAPCVFVGRCADYVLRDWKKCLRVWIGAEEDICKGRLYDEYLTRTGNLSEKLRLVDQGRSSYYRRCTGQVWGENYNYHMHLDSGTLGVEECSRMVCTAVKKIDFIYKEAEDC